MGFNTHVEIDEPADDTKVWRYMDLGKYLDLVTTASLVMPNATLMQDPYEGQVGGFNQRLEIPSDLVMSHEQMEQARRTIAQARRDLQAHTYLSCWHAAEHESAGMWSLYADEDKGVAVITTWGRLKASLQTDVLIHGGAVQYLDYDAQRLPEDNALSIYCFKRVSFEHEREVRLVIQNIYGLLNGMGMQHPTEPGQEPALLAEARKLGVARIPINLDSMVDEVRVSPAAHSWFADMVAQVTAQCGGQWRVSQSDLYTLR